MHSRPTRAARPSSCWRRRCRCRGRRRLRSTMWSSAQSASDSDELPASSNIFTATRRASGATPTTPSPLYGAAAVPATCVPWPWPSLGGAPVDAVQAGCGIDARHEVGMVEIDSRVENRDPSAVPTVAGLVGPTWAAEPTRRCARRRRAASLQGERASAVTDTTRGLRSSAAAALRGAPELEAVERMSIRQTDRSAGRAGQAACLDSGVRVRGQLDDP